MNIWRIATASLVSARLMHRRNGSGVPGFDYEHDKIRGVNLGGWLVLEPYITPSMFNQGWNASNIPVDEFHFTQFLGKEKALEVLEPHWDSWIQESDFQNLADWGFNFARIPVGYWAFLSREEDPYVQGQLKYLDRSIEWARTYGIKVWIDLHGVPGSQNGFDNSGLRDSWEWQNPEWKNLNDTYRVLDMIIERYGGEEFNNVVIGIEPVNEPLGPIMGEDNIVNYYNQSYQMIRKKNPAQGAIFHDGFFDSFITNEWLNLPDFYNVIIDHHRYQVFEMAQLERSIDEHISSACKVGKDMKALENKWHVVGEWSAAMTDCTPLLNGVYRGSRYGGSYNSSAAIGSCEGINDITQWTDVQKNNTRMYVEAQLDSYEYGGSGWVIWCYKTENALEWDLSKLVSHGLFPNPATDRQFKNQCEF